MFNVGRAAIGNTIFFMLAAVGIFMFLVGRWQERYGTRAMITLGIILCSFSVLMAAYASSVIMIYAWAFLTGLSSCFVYIPALTTVQRWYPQKKGLVSGLASMIFGLSAAIMSPLFAKMLASLGYLSMCISIAVLTLIIGLAGAYLARAPEAADSAAPGDTTTMAIAYEAIATRAIVTGVSTATAAQFSEERPQGADDTQDGDSNSDGNRLGMGQEASLTVRESLHTRSFWFLWITWALQGAAGIAMVTLSTAYGLSRGFTLESAIFILTAFNLTNGTGRLVSGILSDIIGRNRIMSIAFFGAGIAYFVFIWASSLAACVLLAAVVGFAFGTLFAVSAPLVADCFGLKHFGAIFGLAFAAYGFAAGLLGPTMSGYLLDITGDNFFPVFIYLGIFCVISGFCIRNVLPARRL
jgi:OFA family oxalate/formate antiporter-like MFS transporter